MNLKDFVGVLVVAVLMMTIATIAATNATEKKAQPMDPVPRENFDRFLIFFGVAAFECHAVFHSPAKLRLTR
ncbi:hypothetical protein BV898_13604 [Hypsibius exemplaris]|uniref:Uncharacterized protein n=1 Tax=Hypsibius exemplaris TaxID=2072580 RepID=A0A1W0WA85_HYPEX|nr:hypothetical protein BV898_13604 [Hypsibius exemplaris]